MSGALRGKRLNTIIIAPTTLQDTAPVEYIQATAAAGYDGIGLRVHRSPGLPFYPLNDAALIRDMKSRIADAGLEVFDLYSFYLQPDTDVARFAPALVGKLGLGTRAMPGEGMLPLREILAALPRDIPLSVELPHALAPQGTSARDWAKMTLERTREFLAQG